MESLTVFISHSVGPVEIPVVNHLSASLTGAGVHSYLALYDRQPGNQLSSKVRAHIDSSDALLALITKRGADSDWVQNEVGFAIGRSKPVIPLVEKGIKPGAMLQGQEYFEFDPSTPNGGVDNVTNYLSWIKSQKELAMANERAARAETRAAQAKTEADQTIAALEAVIVVGVIILLILALSRE